MGKTLLRFLRRHLVVLIILTFGATLSFILYRLVGTWQFEREALNLDRQANRTALILRHGLDHHLRALQEIANFYAASREVERDEFHQFVSKHLHAFPGILAIGWVPAISPRAIPVFEKLARGAGIQNLRIHPLQAGDSQIFPVFFVEPAEPNHPLFGLNLGAFPPEKRALDNARDSGEIFSSAPFSRPDSALVVWRVYMPIYRNGMPHETIEDRRRNLFGFAVGEYSVLGMLNETLFRVKSDDDLQFTLTDQTEAGSLTLYASATAKNHGAPKNDLRWQRSIELAGRTWQLEFRPLKDLYPRRIHPQEAVFLCLAVTLTLAGIFAWNARQRRLTEELIVRRTTELAAIERQLQQSQKMEAIGTLAGGIAHDFNNMLAGILVNTELLRHHTQPGAETEQSIDSIERAAVRAAKLTKQLLDFARRSQHLSQSFDTHGILREVADFAGRAFDKRIHLELRLAAENAMVEGDPDQLHQVFLNLLVNARDALQETGGRITVETSNPPADGDPPHQLRIIVSDDGCGMDAAVRERIFDPFFTTKDPGKGTGMGLAMVYGILKEHRASITVSSQPGRGTRFEILMPLAPPAPAPAIAGTPFDVRPGKGRILLVDDEDVVRSGACRLLEQMGYEVLSAPDGPNAIATYDEFRSRIDLVLMDMVMPEQSGLEAFRLMKAINPDIKVILTSGYTIPEVAQEALAEGVVDFLMKPYQAGMLREAIGKVLG